MLACCNHPVCAQERLDVLGCLGELKDAGFKQLNVLLLGKSHLCLQVEGCTHLQCGGTQQLGNTMVIKLTQVTFGLFCFFSFLDTG